MSLLGRDAIRLDLIKMFMRSISFDLLKMFSCGVKPHYFRIYDARELTNIKKKKPPEIRCQQLHFCNLY